MGSLFPGKPRVFVSGINFAIAFLFSLPAKIRSTEYRVDVIPSAEFVSFISAKRVPGTVGLNANTNKALCCQKLAHHRCVHYRHQKCAQFFISTVNVYWNLGQPFFYECILFVPDSNNRNVERKSQR
jgi:hypothetical protein